MKLSAEQQAFAYDVARLILYIREIGYSCTFGDAYRSPEQALLNEQRGIGIKNSLHCQRLAIDLNLFSPSGEYLSATDDYTIVGDYWETLYTGNRWGGRFKDGNHFERRI